MILAFTGLAGTGKSTASEYLKEKYGYERVNFKDALIAEMKANFPDVLNYLIGEHYGVKVIGKSEREDSFTYGMYIDRLFSEKPGIMRPFMQNYGTEVRRKDIDTYWVEKWIASVMGRDMIVVDDCRFLNEAEAVKNVGGKIIRLVRPDITIPMGHQSETEQSQIKHDMEFVCNKGEHDVLYRMIDLFIQENEGV